MDLIDLRCDGTRKTGPHRGMRCDYLLFRYFPGLDGRVETKCPRCNHVAVWEFAAVQVGGARG